MARTYNGKKCREVSVRLLRTCSEATLSTFRIIRDGPKVYLTSLQGNAANNTRSKTQFMRQVFGANEPRCLREIALLRSISNDQAAF